MQLSAKDRINHVLDEIRIVLPGTEALLGFQLVTIFSEGFTTLPEYLRYIHLGSLACITLTTILLITPSAFDRITKDDHDINDFHSFATRMVIIAMLFLTLGLSGDIYVITSVVIESHTVALTFSGVVLFLCLFLWFGYPFFKRKQQ